MIIFKNVCKQFGSKIVLDNVTVSINHKKRIGLIGLNGTGKTVLLRILTGSEEVDSGNVTLPSDIKIGYLPQEMDINQSISPLNLVLEPFAHLLNSESVIEKIALYRDTESKEYKNALKDLDSLHNELDIVNAHSLPSRAKSILTGLGVPEYSWDLDISNLSGGFHMRVLLCQLLLIEPDFLLLDEPTNHLDMDSLIWLEKFLHRFNGGMLVVSHDRDFLNRLTSDTIELNSGKIMHFSGNVDSYFTWKTECSATEEKRVKNLQNKISQTELFITRFKSKNTKASQARSKMKQLNRLKEKLPEKKLINRAIQFQFPETSRGGSIPIKFENVSVSYGDVHVFNELSFTVNRGDKIAIIGPNGAGKSTLLKTCYGMVKPYFGNVEIGHNTSINYFSQHRLDQLDPSKTVLDTVAATIGICDKPMIQSLLGAFLFSGDDVLKQVGCLSGGEKSRLSLAVMLAVPGNVLLLDEPTNHLDMQSTECLADALCQFQGTLLIVSHDEYFIARIANRLLELRPGKLRDFPGTVADYRSYIEDGYLDTITNSINNDKSLQKDTQSDKDERIHKRQEKKRLERAIDKVERNSILIENEIEHLKKTLLAPANALDFQKLTETNQQINKKKDEYNSLLQTWEKFHAELEELL